ncbi:MAG: hypothetical protein JXB88_09160 [Spirochaetales bacterium]|nr:hypothetical protein [Spirochaetales bacterium]
MRKEYIVIIIVMSIFILAISSCNDLLSTAADADPSNLSKETVSNFTSVVGTNSITLTWRNPAASSFSEVSIFRKTGGFPISALDSTATVIYTGSGSSYEDEDVSTGNTYYYAIFTRNSAGIYSEYGARSVKSFVSFNYAIRQRCFYLIGGSSAYTAADPFANFIMEIDAFDPETDTIYKNIATLPRPRYGCAVASANGKIYIFGGLNANRQTIAKVDVLNVLSPYWPNDVWSATTDMPLPRYSLRAENVNGKLYVFGGSTNSGIPFQGITNINHKFNPDKQTWLTHESETPLLYYPFMNFGSGAYDGTIVYGVGCYTNVGGYTRNFYIHNMASDFYTQIADTDINAYPVPASVLFHKVLSDNTDRLLYFVLGGASVTSAYLEPLRQTNGNPLESVNNSYYFKLTDGMLDANDGALTGAYTMNQTRAYAQAEYYGDYIYVFGGIANGGITPLDSYEKLQIPDNLNFALPDCTGWEGPTTGLNARYAFDITRVNN